MIPCDLMRTLGLLLFVFILSLISTGHADEPVLDSCPIESLGETPLDCPWAMIARQAAASKNIEALLESIAPDFLRRIEHEGRVAGRVKKLWGRSINFDENAKGTIIAEPLIDLILAKAGVPARQDRIVYAGFEHTYGYLLSILKTPYGYKRLRWVRPDIENGFGLEKGSISPAPKSGGLFMNVSYFAGQIAFAGKTSYDRSARKILRRARGVARSIRKYPYEKLHGRRLTETLRISDSRTLEIRTDFVPFIQTSAESTGENTELLVYSIYDSAEKFPYLISTFPIAKGFSDNALNPENLGENKPIITRYNAFVSGLTDIKTPLTGKREASQF